MALTEDPIQTHPFFETLKTRYAWDAAKEQFAETLPEASGQQTALSGGSQKTRKNPLFGVENWLVVGAVFRKTYSAKTIPSGLLRGIGTIVDKPPGIEQFKIDAPASMQNPLRVCWPALGSDGPGLGNDEAPLPRFKPEPGRRAVGPARSDGKMPPETRRHERFLVISQANPLRRSKTGRFNWSPPCPSSTFPTTSPAWSWTTCASWLASWTPSTATTAPCWCSAGSGWEGPWEAEGAPDSAYQRARNEGADRKTPFPDLPSLTRVTVQMRGVGGSNGYRDWSDGATHPVV